MGSGEGSATANGDPELQEQFSPDELHFFGLPIDLWARAQVGRITIFYTAGRLIFAAEPDFRDVAWDMACDLYLPEGSTINHGTGYEFCEGCKRDYFYFSL